MATRKTKHRPRTKPAKARPRPAAKAVEAPTNPGQVAAVVAGLAEVVKALQAVTDLLIRPGRGGAGKGPK